MSHFRYTAYFVINLIMPSFMINVLCIFNFMIPCSSGEKAGYGITVFLAQSVNLMVVMEMMPQGGVSILGMFLAVSIALIGLSLLMNIITLRVYSPQDCSVPPSIRLRKLGKRLQCLVGPRDVPRDIVLSQKNFYKLSETFFDALSVDDLTYTVQPGGASATYDDLLSSNVSDRHFVANKLFEKQLEPSLNHESPRSASSPEEITQTSPTIPVTQQNGIKQNARVRYKNDDNSSADRYRPNVDINDSQNGIKAVSSNLNNFTKPIISESRKRNKILLPETANFLSNPIGSPSFGAKKYSESDTALNDRALLESLETDPTKPRVNPHNYTAEYQFLAETINRFNAFIFSALLMLTCGLYWIYHDPTSFANNYNK